MSRSSMLRYAQKAAAFVDLCQAGASSGTCTSGVHSSSTFFCSGSVLRSNGMTWAFRPWPGHRLNPTASGGIPQSIIPRMTASCEHPTELQCHTTGCLSPTLSLSDGCSSSCAVQGTIHPLPSRFSRPPPSRCASSATRSPFNFTISTTPPPPSLSQVGQTLPALFRHHLAVVSGCDRQGGGPGLDVLEAPESSPRTDADRFGKYPAAAPAPECRVRNASKVCSDLALRDEADRVE